MAESAGRDRAGNAGQGWRFSDVVWERLGEAGLKAFDAQRAGVAKVLWRAAQAFARGFDAEDPRRAATLNNLAAARQLRGAVGEADDLYRRALEVWDAAESWIDRMCTEQRARSSVFHLRLEQKYRQQYTRLARQEYRRILHEGRAATLGNLRELCAAQGRAEEAAELGVRAGASNDRRAASGLARWNAERPAGFTDVRKLTAAVWLTARVETVEAGPDP